ncbi:diguanylate cyclase [Blastococcus sp. KM273129]|uniref:GGDEF domain-containing protein n=1 Tax=Blastococcus sp. KM273129 TaxID=2570315 RepID=UPI001F3B5AC5|nr:GGDEF domain-containing protein [Blastococcus sp. KM273129]MCF6737424.1 GGDEF domain-containing protein [Blastococcus sp. KM273129]
MTFPSCLRTREPRAAARTAVVVLAICAGMLALVGLLGPAGEGGAGPAVIWACVAGLVAVAALFHVVPAERLDRAGAFLLLAVVGVTVLCVLAVYGGGTSTRSQAFLAFVVLYAGFHLRVVGAVLATVVAVVADAVMIFDIAPANGAVTDFVFSGAMLGVVGGLLIRATGNQERLVAALRQQADVDALTGLVTRRVFDQALEERRAASAAGAGTALLLLDIDRFKMINDVHGHLAGDDALVHLSAVIKRQIRAVDALASRLGGDEVAVLLRDCSREVAARRAEQLLDAVRGAPLVLPDGSRHTLSVSVGVSHVPDAVADLRELYSSADIALYAAKRGGRGRVEVALAGA